MKICEKCGKEYQENKHTPYQKFCSKGCQPKREYNQKWRSKYHTRLLKDEARKRDMLRIGTRREVILKRDEYKCRMCGSKENLLIHHKDGQGRRSKKKNNKKSNLLTLCFPCHATVHKLGLGYSKKKKYSNT